LRVQQSKPEVWAGKQEFFAHFTTAVSSILIDYWRRRQSRPAQLLPVSEEADLQARELTSDEQAMLNEAMACLLAELADLATEKPLDAQVFELDVFGAAGEPPLAMKEIAARLGLRLDAAYRARKKVTERLHRALAEKFKISLPKEEGT
jgi:DNA-directed RNA polymerase specialized sigma24 family protein